MPEADVLTRAFATFADEASVEIAGPGSAAVRRIVRNRRARRSVVTAFALVLVLVGGVAVWARTGSGRAAPADSGDWTPRPDSAATLEVYREQAVNALPHMAGVLGSDSAIITGHYTNPARDIPEVAKGSVTIYFVCIGTGSLTVDVHVRGFSGTSDVNCTSGGGWSLDPTAIESDGGYLYIEITPSLYCVRLCSFAYEIVDGDTTGN